jgi:hypothetical protein
MKKTILLVLILVVVGALYVYNKDGGDSNRDKIDSEKSADLTTTEKISDKLLSYRNDELGFKVAYPNTWEIEDVAGKVTFVMPRVNPTASTTLGNISGTIEVLPGKCAFPPVTTVSDRASLKGGEKGDIPFDMISMSNTVQGRTYFNRMYSTPKDSICFMFTFSSITLNPASKGVPVAQVPTVQTNNKTFIDVADKAFTDNIIKSFSYVTIEGGQNEADYKPSN